MTPTDRDQFERGEMKGDFGRKPKALMALVRNLINMIADLDIGVVATNHTYASQDMFDPEDKISGGSGFVYASSIVVGMKKKKLKEDEAGNKITDVVGIKSTCKVIKSRYAKPFESVEINIPYDKGVEPYSGLFDLFEKAGVLVKQGNRYRYISKRTNQEYIEFRKAWMADTDKMDMLMNEFSEEDFQVLKPITDDEGE